MDPENDLPAVAGGLHDLGRNGSYLVFRQLSQDVKRFWEYVNEQAQALGRGDRETRDWIAAKMVGRWRNGVPLVLSPDHDRLALEGKIDLNQFGYVGGDRPGGNDALGLKCPLGSHVRRANPRDSVFPRTSGLLTDSNKHRILRRGRSYGIPLAASLDPDEILAAEDTGEERGLHFICFNSDLGRQFEFVQHTWVNNPKFAGLAAELDPLVGDHGPRHRTSKGVFSIPANPVRKQLTGIQRFVAVRGGAYFFLPGIRALRFLARLATDGTQAGGPGE